MSTALTKDDRIKSVLDTLPQIERNAYRYFVEANQPEISEKLSKDLYDLFVAGKNCVEIAKLKPGLTLGSIVHARIRDSWDQRRDDEREALEVSVPDRVRQTQLEAADFLTKMLMVGHKRYTEKFDQYLLSGKAEDLAGTPMQDGMSLKQYRDILDTLMKATGQDQKRVLEVKGGVTVTTRRQANPEEAGSILEALLGTNVVDAAVVNEPKALPAVEAIDVSSEPVDAAEKIEALLKESDDVAAEANRPTPQLSSKSTVQPTIRKRRNVT